VDVYNAFNLVLVSHFLRVTIFVWFSKLTFPIHSTILCTPIPIIFFSSFSTWGSHSHFVGVRYTIGGPIEKNTICFSSPLHFSPYNNSPPYLCFPFVGGWYTYNRFCINCGSYFFTIATWIFNIKTFNATSEVCNLVFTRVNLVKDMKNHKNKD
jgi:hypothetical protein